MKYSYEFKCECVRLHKEGKWKETPEGVSKETFHNQIKKWERIAELNGIEALRHKEKDKKWRPEEKLELVNKVLVGGNSTTSIACEKGISKGMLVNWIHKYQEYGYNGLVNQKRGRPPKSPDMRKKIDPAPLTETEREELIRLRETVARITAENEVIKKKIALREAKWDEEARMRKQRSSRNSSKKDTN